MSLGTLHLDARLRIDPDLEFAEQLARSLLSQLQIPMPKGGFKRSSRTSARASERWIPAVYKYKKQEIRLGERFDHTSQQHVYTLLHELAHHVDRSRRGIFTHRRGETHHAESFSRALADLLTVYGVKFTNPCEYEMVKQDLAQMLRGTGLLPEFQGKNYCTTIQQVPVATREIVAAVRQETARPVKKAKHVFVRDEKGELLVADVIYEIKKQKVLHYYIKIGTGKPFMISSQDPRFFYEAR